MQGCKGCLELVAQEDLENCNDYRGHCRREITAQGGVEWSGAGQSGGPARTVGRPDGEGVTDSCIAILHPR